MQAKGDYDTTDMNLILDVMKAVYEDEDKLEGTDGLYERVERLRQLLCYEVLEDEEV